MGPLERRLEQLLANFPNLVSPDLWGRKFPVVKEFGKINVCVRQGKLPECNGQIDLAFITESTVHLVELKRHVVCVDTLQQLKRYIDPIQAWYPNHLIVGYLVGRKCRDLPALRAALRNERVSILLVGQEIPRKNELMPCENCGAGFHYKNVSCPYCAAD